MTHREPLVEAARDRVHRLRWLHHYASIAPGADRRNFEAFVREPTLYCAAFQEFNDPFEATVPFDFAADESAIREFFAGLPRRDEALLQRVLAARDDPEQQHSLVGELREQVKQYGVYCFTEHADDLPMWSYYADEHRGVCLRFHAPRLIEEFEHGGRGVLVPIDYAERPRIRWYDASDTTRTWTVLATKAHPWSHEREWRLVLTGGEQGCVPCAKDCLAAVIVGCRMPAEVREYVARMVREHRPGVALLETVPRRECYELEVREMREA